MKKFIFLNFCIRGEQQVKCTVVDVDF